MLVATLNPIQESAAQAHAPSDNWEEGMEIQIQQQDTTNNHLRDKSARAQNEVRNATNENKENMIPNTPFFGQKPASEKQGGKNFAELKSKSNEENVLNYDNYLQNFACSSQ